MATTWINRVWSEFHAGNLTRDWRDVLLTLHGYRGAGGQCTPAHATLAARARCCVRTVQRALKQAERLGLVLWSERRRLAGWRWLRTSNIYRLTTPDGPARPGCRLPRTTGPADRGSERIKIQKKAADETSAGLIGLPDPAACRSALAEIATRREAERRAAILRSRGAFSSARS